MLAAGRENGQKRFIVLTGFVFRGLVRPRFLHEFIEQHAQPLVKIACFIFRQQQPRRRNHRAHVPGFVLHRHGAIVDAGNQVFFGILENPIERHLEADQDGDDAPDGSRGLLQKERHGGQQGRHELERVPGAGRVAARPVVEGGLEQDARSDDEREPQDGRA